MRLVRSDQVKSCRFLALSIGIAVAESECLQNVGYVTARPLFLSDTDAVALGSRLSNCGVRSRGGDVNPIISATGPSINAAAVQQSDTGMRTAV